MAEARMAVEPTPALQRVGFEVDTSVKKVQAHMSSVGFVLYIPHPYFIAKNIRTSLRRAWMKVKIAFLPMPMSFVLALTTAVTVWVSRSPSSSWQRSGRLASFAWWLDSLNPLSSMMPTQYRVGYLAVYVSGTIIFGFTALQRLLLRQLLSYHGWIKERGTKSLKTKIWGFLLKHVFFRRINKLQEAYEGALPSLPLPPVEETVSKYLSTVEPLLHDKPSELQEVRELASDFLKNEGPRLQNWLRLKWLTSNNYISDWWLQFVYLQGRSSLCINSNWYGITFEKYEPTKNQVARAAAVVYNFIKIKIEMEKGKFEPQMLAGVVPLAMDQYDYAFSTTRVPGREQDTLVKYEPHETKHVAVLHKGKIYKMRVYHQDNESKPITPLMIYHALLGVVNDRAEADPWEKLIPSLTAAPRTTWANIRESYFVHHPYNRVSLESIEKAAFVLCLDDFVPSSTSEEGKSYLCGNGCNRWSDKSFNLCITSNAKLGCHTEHSWGDAPCLALLIERAMCSDMVKEFYDSEGGIKAIEEDDKAKADATFKIYPAERIRFVVEEDLKPQLRQIHTQYLSEIDDLDLKIGCFSKYGKSVCKKAKCSPDAWIQMAMQLAYYRDQQQFVQTYESSMVRFFKAGRTETIRTVSNDSVAFVLSMTNPELNNEERLKLLVKACDRHQTYSHDAMCGKGIDRHLFALTVVAYGKNIPSPFLKNAMSRKWKLSTSQVLPRQLPYRPPEKDDEFRSPNGGFGPVADDGYGVCYSLYGENLFYFNVSSKVSCGHTNSERFLQNIMTALEDLGKLL